MEDAQAHEIPLASQYTVIWFRRSKIKNRKQILSIFLIFFFGTFIRFNLCVNNCSPRVSACFFVGWTPCQMVIVYSLPVEKFN